MSFPGRYGSAICLSGYLSTMFQISDVMPDKQEAALALELNVEIEPAVSEEPDCVSKPDVEKLLPKMAEILSGQGLAALRASWVCVSYMSYQAAYISGLAVLQ